LPDQDPTNPPVEDNAPGAEAEAQNQTPSNHARAEAAPRGVRGFFGHLAALGRDVRAIARGAPIEPTSADRSPDAPGARANAGDQKVGMLHSAAERLRGAADSYIAVKLDEIEARVDAKLNHIEERVDEKMLDLHRQLRELRDRELRHRLRLLKITLVFTVLVAALSLGYKLVAKYLVG
jgi:hypothetical protein